MKRLEVSGAVRPIYVSLGVKRLKKKSGTEIRTVRLASYRRLFFLPAFAMEDARELNPAKEPFLPLMSSVSRDCCLFISLN